MKTEVFLNKLKKEKRLGLVEPNINIKKSYFEKSESNIISSKALLKIDRLEEATSLAYYSAYHSLLALLYGIGIKCENHSASAILLKELFGLLDLYEIFLEFKKDRIDNQYYLPITNKEPITKEKCNERIKIAQKFNLELRAIIERKTLKEISEIRNKFKEGGF